ncbi:MAG: serpin family protein [Actinomycetota bacterium]
MIMRRLTVLAAAVVLIACGSDSDPADTSTSSSPPGTTTATTGPAGEAVRLEPSEGVERSRPDERAPVAELVAGFNDAGFQLMGDQAPGDNLVFSPLSIGHALLMARGAADEATGAAIDGLFSLPDGRAAHEAWNALDQAMAHAAEAEEDLTLSVADRIWPDLDVEPDQGWIDLLASEHGASVEVLDLQGDPEGSRDTINAWVSDRTQELIPELLPEGFIDTNTLLVLTDAIYFEASWRRPFGKYPEEEGSFTTVGGSEVDVSFMHELELVAPRGEGDGFRGAEIPYVGGEYSMLVLVPEEGRFEEVRDRLGQDLLDEIDSSFTEADYELFLPKWDDHTDLDLMPWLEEAGAAPGSYPLIAPPAFLGGAVHGADISVDEEGTVAAAATGLAFEESAAPQPEFTLRADRPFLYLIRHRPSGAVLFAGQVTDPTS